MRFTEERLEQAIIELLEESYPRILGRDIAREPSEVLIKEDLRHFLAQEAQTGLNLGVSFFICLENTV